MANLYRDMDRAALDAAYNNGAAVADSDRFIARWEQRSAQLRAERSCRLDLRYGDAPRNRLDFFTAGERRAATLLFIHGGYWQSRAKELFSFVAEGPLSLGTNVALISYTLAPEARLDRIVGECRQALAWLAAHVAELGGDPARLYVAGWSAGAHLTAMLMQEAAIKGALAISGIYDLEPIRLNYLNDKLGLDDAEAQRNSPLLHLPAQAAPLLVTVGGDELPELRRQSETYHAAWRSHGLPGTFVPLPGRHHYAAVEELARPDGVLTRALAELVF
ncbi:MAG TPA: alpha/beta hydrolase [Stellaceae bacterium]